MVDLIEETTTTDIELRRGPSDGVRRLLLAGLGVAGLVLVVSLFRPSDDIAAPAPNAVTSTIVAPNSGIGTDETDDVAPGESLLPEPFAGGNGFFGRPLPVEIPDLIDLPANVRLPLAIVGQNYLGQIVAIDLETGSVREIDPVTGQRFVARSASDQNVVGFRVFLGETIAINALGQIRSMPVTEMDLPLLFPAADGDGFVIHAAASNQLWVVSDDGEVAAGPLALPEDIAVQAAVASGLIVQTRDGVNRRFDPFTRVFGDPLVGQVVAIGRTRYVSLACDGGSCSVASRSLEDDAPLADLTIEPVPADHTTISPSDELLALIGGGVVTVVDLSNGAVVAELPEGGNAQFVWAPNDTLVYWSNIERRPSPENFEFSSEPRPIYFFVPDDVGEDDVRSVEVPPELLDPAKPIHVVAVSGTGEADEAVGGGAAE